MCLLQQWKGLIVKCSALLLGFMLAASAVAAERTVNLGIGYKTVNFTGQPAQALAVNNQIPGPILHFKEGDTVTINVYNHLQEGTTIHWHGLILPWQMDGVEYVSQAPIPPGGVFHYHFTLKQSGTYWYHAHAGFQEQEGVYGAMIIDPVKPPLYHYNKDDVIILSDWSNTPANSIYAKLKKEGGYYATEFPLQASLFQFISQYRKADPANKQQVLSAYRMMQQTRMSLYDISDVAYQAFLLNGKPNTKPWTAAVAVGDVVRLRFINAGGSSIFNVKIPGTSMELVNVDGNDVKPLTLNDFKLTPGETYDVLVKITEDRPYIIYAESADTSGAAYGALLTQVNQTVDYAAVKPFPLPQPMMMGHGAMSDSGHSMVMEHDHEHDMASMTVATSDSSLTIGTKYQDLASASQSNDPTVPVTEIHMVLSGYMDRYIWFINGVPEYDAKPIIIEPGKRYRLVFVNNSMMDHPMHLHGHWMILRNGHEAYDPKMHTIDVPPGATVVADFDADASGQWYFHCHNAFHMASGMARLFRYSDFADSSDSMANAELNHSAVPSSHPMHLSQASYFELAADPFNNVQEATFKSLIGYDYNKLEIYSEHAQLSKGVLDDANVDIFYWHLIGEFWALKGGANYNYRPGVTPYWQPGIGIEGLMPYFIDTDVRIYQHAGSIKLNVDLSRDSQITNKFFIRTGIQASTATKTVAADEVGSGLNQMQYIIRPYYQLSPSVSLYTEFDYTQDYGTQTQLDDSEGQASHSTTLLFGLSMLF